MPLNSLLGQAGFKLGPLVLETLVKHYCERILKERGDGVTQLSQDELLYDEAFHIIKTFMEAATKHTVEDLQEFSNTRTPSPPWTRVIRLVVPMSCCDDAATYLIKALGGPEVTKRVVGGTKWWQVRGIRGVDAEWLTAKKDWQQAKRRHKEHLRNHPKGASSDSHKGSLHRTGSDGRGQEGPAIYEPEMDKMPCILYAHGGGYYFGSIDQERFSIERYARKINGRAFTINYRLAPQYPFPCAVQDFLAAYLYLIRPPEGASHSPVDPGNIIVAGDSAGGGLSIALLQIIRDSGLPMPAGAVLISPWCDLTHSFPSIHTNNATDVLPPYGLSFHKPSTLWPPPPDDLTTEVQNTIRHKARQIFHMRKGPENPGPASQETKGHAQDNVAHQGPAPQEVKEHARDNADYQFVVSPTGQTLHLGPTASLPTPSSVRDQTITLCGTSGEMMKIEEQIQLYTPNYLLTHPLVSPVVSYLGGLPPLFIIASDKEVIRDEVIYFAHKAAYPDRFHVKESARNLYPALEGIESRYGPTKVHLQVYDDAAHTLPTLFAFTTPAKYCYRAIATFCKYITGSLPTTRPSNLSGDIPFVASPTDSSPYLSGSPSSEDVNASGPSPRLPTDDHPFSTTEQRPHTNLPHTLGGPSDDRRSVKSGRRSLRRTVSVSVTRASTFLNRAAGQSSQVVEHYEGETSEASDVAGPRFGKSGSSGDVTVRKAGEGSVYENGLDSMIRERVSTRGVIRPLEPEEELLALQFPEELIGEISELVMRRYFVGREKFTRKFAHVVKNIEKKRRRNLTRARHETLHNLQQLQAYLLQDENASSGSNTKRYAPKGLQEGLVSVGSWPWAWALDEDEEPPASSIVARRDTEEARHLARIADKAFLADENTISGNNLWTVMVNFLSKTPGKDKHEHEETHGHESESKNEQVDGAAGEEKQDSKFKWLPAGHKKHHRRSVCKHKDGAPHSSP